MNRVAVFVDAGYVFAAGSATLTGSKKQRQFLTLKKSETIELLKHIAQDKSNGKELLRIYWYDGADGYKGQTSEQSELAYLDDVKIRLGFINSHGQQKGVDSLIVTDLIELARNRSIADAVLISGDEDVRVGVQMAQNFGVRVHLVGIEPCRASQSNLLMQEADTCSGLNKAQISNFLGYDNPENLLSTLDKFPGTKDDSTIINQIVETYINTLSEEKLSEAQKFVDSQKSIPPEHDGRMLTACREELGRDLSSKEKPVMRLTARKLFGK